MRPKRAMRSSRLCGPRQLRALSDWFALVHPDFQRQGLGTRLIGDLMARARDSSRPLTLRVLVVNPARDLYARLGFVVTETTREYHFMEWNP